MTFYQLEENYCDCQFAYTNIVESFTDREVADYWCTIFNEEKDCQYTNYWISVIEPLQDTYEDLIENTEKYDIEILGRYRQWRRM